MSKRLLTAALTVSLVSAGSVPSVFAAKGVDSYDLREAITQDNLELTLLKFEEIGERVPGSSTYAEAAAYIRDALMDVGYEVSYQFFNFEFWEELSDPVFNDYTPYDPDGFATMEYSGAGDVEADVVKAEVFGCDSSDFSQADFTGKIALIERGECTFAQKAQNAEEAGAVAAIIYNDFDRQDAFLGTLGGPGITIPVIGTSYTIGQELQPEETVTANIVVDAQINTERAYNVLAETPTGRDDRVVLVGAHLDGVAGTPAINDNGSGSAAILEIAKQIAESGIEPVNKLRFAFWTAEESGLVGSEYYVASLSDKEKKDIAVNLNFDMLRSPNFVRMVYDGDGSTFEVAGPNGSANIEQVFADYFTLEGLPFEETEFDGRSDYGPFIEAGIPAGGLFAGADDIKTEEQVELYGGTAGEMLDPNYHTPDDVFDAVVGEAATKEYEVMTDAAAHAVLTFAMTTSAVNGTAKSSPVAKGKMVYRGPNAQK